MLMANLIQSAQDVTLVGRWCCYKFMEVGYRGGAVFGVMLIYRWYLLNISPTTLGGDDAILPECTWTQQFEVRGTCK